MPQSFHKLTGLLVALIFSTQALTAGPSTGGGGDAVILPDDSVVLADPFLDMSGQQPNNMPPLRALNPRILMAVKSYLEVSKNHLESLSAKKPASGKKKDKPSVEVKPDLDTFKSDIAKLMKELSTRKSKLRVYAVRNQEELGMYCAPGGRKSYILPTGARVEQVACTAGEETFLVEPLFVRMSLKDQSLLMIHERLTTLRDMYGGKNYSAIARFTTGLSHYLELYREQYKGQYRRLTSDEQKALTNFYMAIEEIELRNSEVDENSFQWTVAPYGGGRVHTMSHIDESALVGLGAILRKDSDVASAVVIKNTFFEQPVTIIADENSIIENVTFYFDNDSAPSVSTIAIGRDSKLRHTSVRGKVFIGSQSEIYDSTLDGNLNVGDSTSIKGSKLYAKNLTIPSQGQVENFSIDPHIKNKINYVTLHKVKNGRIDSESIQYLPPDVKIEPVDKTWTVDEQNKILYNYLDRDGAEKWADFLKGSTVFNESGLRIEVGSSFKYSPRGIFGNGYNFEFKKTKYRIQFVPQGLPTETRPDVYTVWRSSIVPVTGGKKSISYKVAIDNGSYRTPDHRLKHLLELFQEIGFEIVGDIGRFITVKPKIQ